MKKVLLNVLALCLLTTPIFAESAAAEPTAVTVRVEGRTTTIFEGVVTTDAKQLDKGDGPHPCDGTGGGVNPLPGPTMTTALDDASVIGGFSWSGTWFGGFGDFGIDAVGPDANDYVNNYWWGYALNYKASMVGGCGQQVKARDEVLFAYDFFSKVHNLKLAGPSVAQAGNPVEVKVTDGDTGVPIDSATVGGATTNSSGVATVSLDASGTRILKAERADSVRSNALAICAYKIAVGECTGAAGPKPGSTDPAPATDLPVAAPVSAQDEDRGRPSGRILRLADRVRLGKGPRLLRGTASDSATGVATVEMALKQRDPGATPACRWWNPKNETFVRRGCKRPRFFAVGQGAEWSYLMPFSLPRGRYVLLVETTDRAGNRERAHAPGRNRVRFEVGDVRGSAAAKKAGVEVMVAGRSTVPLDAISVNPAATVVQTDSGKCGVGRSTALAALVRAAEDDVDFTVRDFGTCSRKNVRDSAQLFVDSIGQEANRGSNGWVYKINGLLTAFGAADPAGQKLRNGDRLLWMYCIHKKAGCQRSLEIDYNKPGSTDTSLTVTVSGLDDRARPKPIAGATVKLGETSAVTDGRGSAVLPLEQGKPQHLTAEKEGLAPAFPVHIQVG